MMVDEAPLLVEGDVVKVYGYPSDLFTVDGFRAHGMLVDCIRHADGQVFTVPRHQHQGGWLTAIGRDGEVTDNAVD